MTIFSLSLFLFLNTGTLSTDGINVHLWTLPMTSVWGTEAPPIEVSAWDFAGFYCRTAFLLGCAFSLHMCRSGNILYDASVLFVRTLTLHGHIQPPCPPSVPCRVLVLVI